MKPYQRQDIFTCMVYILGMGTISSLAFLYHFGYRSTPLKMITLVFFFIELTSYLLFCAMSITPCLLYLDVFLV